MTPPDPVEEFNVLLTWLCILSGIVLVALIARLP
jgi:hypothetical protein